MSIITTEFIPLNKLQDFIQILGITGGRFLSNPVQYPNKKQVYVHYVHGDYKKFYELWNNLNLVIKEVDRNQKWRVLLRRLGFKRIWSRL